LLSKAENRKKKEKEKRETDRDRNRETSPLFALVLGKVYREVNLQLFMPLPHQGAFLRAGMGTAW
jgi:hypothetical protein